MPSSHAELLLFADLEDTHFYRWHQSSYYSAWYLPSPALSICKPCNHTCPEIRKLKSENVGVLTWDPAVASIRHDVEQKGP